MSRTILHLDLDAFYCAVEEIQNPGLRGRPFAVGGRPNERGVVASCSYAARRLGIHSAMPMSRALKLCGNLIIVPGRHRLYEEYSDKVMEKLRKLTDQVEQISIDEAFLELTAIHGSPIRLARDLQTGIRDELHLPCSIGIASNKLVAKIATEVGKKSARGSGPPYGLTVVPAGDEADFLAPLPATMLWGVGPKTFTRMSELGIQTIGDIGLWPEKDLVRIFGENGRDLWRHARGMDDRQIVTEYEVKSVSQETTFSTDIRDDKKLENTLRELAVQVGRQLRRNDMAGKTVKLKLRWPDFTTITRQVTLPSATDQDDEIIRSGIRLLRAARKPNQPVRLIGIGVSGIGPPVSQLSLWEAGTEKSRKLQEVVDALQEKYGKGAIHKGEMS